MNVGIWCIGEYGDLLLKQYSYNPPSSSSDPSDLAGMAPVTVTFMALEPAAVVEIVEEVVNRPTCPMEVKQRALTCFAKLRERFADVADATILDKLHNLVEKHKGSHSLELQLRSCEYGALINAIKGISVKSGGGEDDIFGGGGGGESVSETVKSAAKEALARMPVVDVKLLEQKRQERSGDIMADNGMDMFGGEDAAAPAPAASGGGEPSLLDLDDIFGGGGVPAAPK
jgi:AP-1 complex subunit gamma-1